MHHAQLIIGSREACIGCLPEDVQSENIDVRHLTFSRMSITDARSLIQEALLRPVTRDIRTFVIYADSIPTETQNALLKLFEEPNDTTVFFLMVPREHILIPTLRSRLILHTHIKNTEKKNDILSTFLNQSYAERLDIIAKKIKNEDHTWVEAFSNECSRFASESASAPLIRDVLMLETNIRMQGSSIKMLLEHLALSLPPKAR